MRNTLKRSIQHILKSWSHHAGLQLSTALVLLSSFSVILGSMTLTKNLQGILTLWGDSLQMSVFINESTAPEKFTVLNEYLNHNKKIDKVTFVSSEKALNDFREQMASYAPGLLNDADLLKFIPKSFQISFKDSFVGENPLESMKAIASEIKNFEGVDEVSFGQDWVKNYSLITKAIQIISSIIIAIAGIGSLFIISNSIRSSISQRRKEIEVLELIGATDNYLRLPFIIEGAVLGFASSLASVILVWAGFTWLKGLIHTQLSFMQLSQYVHFLSLENCIAIIAIGTMLGALSSWLCVRQINSGWAAASRQNAGNE